MKCLWCEDFGLQMAWKSLETKLSLAKGFKMRQSCQVFPFLAPHGSSWHGGWKNIQLTGLQYERNKTHVTIHHPAFYQVFQTKTRMLCWDWVCFVVQVQCSPFLAFLSLSLARRSIFSNSTETWPQPYKMPAFCGGHPEVLAAVILVSFLLAFRPWSWFHESRDTTNDFEALKGQRWIQGSFRGTKAFHRTPWKSGRFFCCCCSSQRWCEVFRVVEFLETQMKHNVLKRFLGDMMLYCSSTVVRVVYWKGTVISWLCPNIMFTSRNNDQELCMNQYHTAYTWSCSHLCTSNHTMWSHLLWLFSASTTFDWHELNELNVFRDLENLKK